MQTLSRNTFLSTFLCVLPFLLYSLTQRTTSCPRCTGRSISPSSPNGATAKWALLQPVPGSSPSLAVVVGESGSRGTSTTSSSSSSTRGRGVVNNPGPPPPPRTMGFPYPPIASLDLWAGHAAATPAMEALLGTCWMLRSEGPLPKDAGSDYPDYLYEVCFGDRIKQIPHPYTENRVVMGVFAGWGEGGGKGGGGGGGGTQLYAEGTLCEGWGKREVTVQISCDPSAVVSPRIMDVQEPEVCKYTMALVTAAAC